MPLYPEFERVYRPDTPDALPPPDAPAVWLPLRGHDVVVDVGGEPGGRGRPPAARCGHDSRPARPHRPHHPRRT